MANVIKNLLNFDLLLAVGLLIAFIGQASFIPESISGILAPFAGIGYLLLVVAGGLAVYNRFKK